jgi:hypothetical protein
VSLSIALTSAALFLAVPGGLIAFLLAFRAIGPWRTRPRIVRMPDLADEGGPWVGAARVAHLQPMPSLQRNVALDIPEPWEPVAASRPRRRSARHLDSFPGVSPAPQAA